MRKAVLLALCASPQLVDSFLNPSLHGNPELDLYSRSLEKSPPLEVCLEIVSHESGSPYYEDAPRLAVGGFQLRLRGDVASADRPALPGVDGPHPSLSGGPRLLEIIKDGTFVSMEGTQKVQLGENACWEMIWRDDAPAGSVVCAFQSPKEYKRNGAALPEGRIYWSFPIWARGGLLESQAYKLKVTGLAEQHEQEKIRQLEKMRQTGNVLLKALHYRNAVAAAVEFDRTGIESVQAIPDSNDVMTLGDSGLMICTKGTVWTKRGSWGGRNHLLIGSASMRPAERLP